MKGLSPFPRDLGERALERFAIGGTGQHVVHFAQARPDLEWQPSDPKAEARSSMLPGQLTKVFPTSAHR